MNLFNQKLNSKRYSSKFKIRQIDEIRIKKILFEMKSQKKVLDLGCGDGFLMEKIKSNGNQVYGVEISKPSVLVSRKKGLNVYEIDLNRSWASKVGQRFDSVYAGEVIEHIFDTDRFLQEIRKVLKNHGQLIITTPNLASFGRRILLLLGKNPFIETTNRTSDAGHIHYFTYETLEKLLIENQFEIESFQSVVVSLSPWGNPRSTLAAKLFPTLGNSLIVVARKK